MPLRRLFERERDAQRRRFIVQSASEHDCLWQMLDRAVISSRDIKEFFARFDQEEAFARSNEVKILKKFARDIRKKLPIDPIEKLKSQLQKALARVERLWKQPHIHTYRFARTQ